MIKFFRKIRQKLLSENKFSKYLIYAIGEIILVVIGILIALQINNLNESNKSTNSENKALLDLKKEFISNMNGLSRICSYRAENDSLLRDYLNMVTNANIEIEDKIEKDIPGVFGVYTELKTTVLSGIINSGGLDKIKNDSLKSLLLDWPILVNRWEKRESFLPPVMEKRRDYMATKIFQGIPLIGENWVKDFPNYDYEKLSAQRKNFVNDLEFHNLNAAIIAELWIQQVLCNRIEVEHQKIMEILDQEIKSRKLQ